MTVKFIHLRPGTSYDPASRKVVGTPSPSGGTTIAYELLPESGTVKVAIASCHQRDSFNRRLGRLISSGRLNKGIITIGHWDKGSGTTLAEMVIDLGGFLLEGGGL